MCLCLFVCLLCVVYLCVFAGCVVCLCVFYVSVSVCVVRVCRVYLTCMLGYVVLYGSRKRSFSFTLNFDKCSNESLR